MLISTEQCWSIITLQAIIQARVGAGSRERRGKGSGLDLVHGMMAGGVRTYNKPPFFSPELSGLAQIPWFLV